jgi:hypothetical protein
VVLNVDQEERFWASVDKSGECWIWMRALHADGYGLFRASYPVRKMVTSHRFAYELANGPVPKGYVIDHACHNRACVRPDHLRAVTNKENCEHRGRSSATARSGIRGVIWNGTLGRWRAQVRHNRKLHVGGHFETIEEASEAVRRLRNLLFTNNDFDRDADD